MKTFDFKRVLLFLHWLVSAVLMIGLVVLLSCTFALDTVAEIIVVVLGAVLLAALSGSVFWILYKNLPGKKDQNFVTIDASETGHTAISINALEQMTKQAVVGVEGISEMKIAITNEDEAIDIAVNVTLVGGSHVPTVTMNMQQAIRHFVELNCGVSVRSVSVSIDAVTSIPENGRKGKRADRGLTPVPVPVPVPVEEPAEEPVQEPAGEYSEEIPFEEEPAEAFAEEECVAEEPEIELVLVEESDVEEQEPAEELYIPDESEDLIEDELPEEECFEEPEEVNEEEIIEAEDEPAEEEAVEDPLAECFPDVDEAEEALPLDDEEIPEEEPKKILE